jgi:hypothetical protein
MPTKAERAVRDHLELWRKLDGFFRSSLDHPTWIEWRGEARTDFAYKEGEQWTPAELAVLQDRGQPPTVNNQIKVTVDRIVGQFLKQRTRVGFRGRNVGADDRTAELLTDFFRFIKQNNNLEYEEREVLEDGVTAGFGCLHVGIKFDPLFNPEIRLRHVDPFEVFVDPWSRCYDWNKDARFVLWARWVEISEAVAMWPEHADALMGMFDGRGTAADALGNQGVDEFENRNYADFNEDGTPRTVRVVEAEWREREREEVVVVDDERGVPSLLRWDSLGREDRKRLKGQRRIRRVRDVQHRAVFTGQNIILEPDEADPHGGPLFSWVPYYDRRRKNGAPYSMVRTARSLQDALNKRESKALHLLNVNQAIIQEGAVKNKAEFAEELQKPDGILEVRKVDQMVLEKNVDLASAQFQMHNDAKISFRQVTGVNPEALGERSEVRSGVGIARKQAMTDVIVTPVFDNFRRTRVILAQVVLQFIKTYYTRPKIEAIIDDLGDRRDIELTLDNLRSIRSHIYDVVVEEMPDQTTLQQEQMQLVGTLMTQLPIGDPRLPLILEMSDIRNKDELIARIQKMTQPPPPAPKVSLQLTWADLNEAEKAAFATMMQIPGLAEAQEEGTKPRAEIQQDTELAKTAAKTSVDREKMGLELLRGAQEGANGANRGG